MKTLGKLKLNQFSKEELDQRKMNALKGGCVCSIGCSGCACSYGDSTLSTLDYAISHMSGGDAYTY